MSIPAEHVDAWNTLAQKPHQEQAIWFLNAFWNEGIKEKAEDIWSLQEKFASIDPNTGTGYDHDEFWSHKFLEDLGETISVVDLRKKLGEIDIDKNKRMCLSEYLLFKYARTVKDLVTAPQGDPEELARAQALVDEASRAVDQVLDALEAQKQTAKKAAADEEAAAQKQLELQAAKKDLEVALEEVKVQEAAYNAKTEELKSKSEGGGVAALRAKNELAQHLGEDPLPLRRAKISAEAAVKLCERAQKAAAAAQQAAAASRVAAEEKARELEVKLNEAEQKRKEALEYLDRVKAAGAGAGQVWWMKRGMYEKQKYLPTAKQTMPYPKPE